MSENSIVNINGKVCLVLEEYQEHLSSDAILNGHYSSKLIKVLENNKIKLYKTEEYRNGLYYDRRTDNLTIRYEHSISGKIGYFKDYEFARHYFLAGVNQLHRENGPAIEFLIGRYRYISNKNQYFLNNIEYTEEGYWKALERYKKEFE